MRLDEENSEYERMNQDGGDSEIESELGKKMETETHGQESIVIENDADIDMIPDPKNLEEAEKTLKYLKNALKNLKKENDEANANYLKSLAEMENFRKRNNRDKEEALKYSNEKILRDLLPVLDFLDLAISHSASYIEQDASGNLKSFVEGIKLAYDEFIKILKNYGAEAIETSGKNFDANFHDAVEMVENSGKPDGTIIEEKRKGYVFKERLLRPAMVSIAKSKN
ncbi:MAG: nucleotide exchange factor GrpE [Candidatus Acidulodesulfobacterium sp.]